MAEKQNQLDTVGRSERSAGNDGACHFATGSSKYTGFYSIMADETMDVGRKEQMVIVLRNVDDNFNTSEDLLGLYSMDHCNAESISSALLDVLLRCKLPLNKLRGQAYDGASVMQGSSSGIGKQILEVESRAIFIQCQAHSLNLAVQDACSHLQPLCDLLSTVNDLVNFIRSSPKRLSELHKIASSKGVDTSIRPLCPTR
jgi:hypothetical protein